MSKGKLIVLSSPSGGGKTTVYRALLADDPNMKYSVSYTTRPKRVNEENGKDYFFVSIKEFKKMIKNKEFLEWEKVYGNYYGTSKKTIMNFLEQGSHCILDLDVKGGRHLKKIFPEGIFIFLKPPSIEELERRLFKRNTDTPKVIKKRLKNVKKELKFSKFYDYIIVNDNIDNVIQKVKKIIYEEKDI